MINLENKNVSYIILSSNNIDAMTDILYAKNYKIIPIKGYYKGNYEESVIAIPPSQDNDMLRNDTLFLLDVFKQECAIIKYFGESNAKKIFKNGSEKPLGVVLYNSDLENRSYIYNELSFSFVEKKTYRYPQKKEDFKKGMIVEYYNNNTWKKKIVDNPETEYERMYKLLIKYKKIRIPN